MMQTFAKPSGRLENLILALAEQYAGVPVVHSYPFSLMLDPSSICHLRCPACIYSAAEAVRSRTFLDLDLFHRIIDEVGPYLYELDLYNWGESLLNNNLPLMLAYAKQYPLEILISTNFSFPLNDDVTEALLNHVDRLIVSLDGLSQETYSKYRVRGKFDLVLKNLKKIATLKDERQQIFPQIEWQFLVFSFNEHELKTAETMAADLGVKFRPLAPYVPPGNRDWLSTLPEYVLPRYRPAEPDCAEAAPATTAETIPQRIWRLSHRRPNRCDWHYLRAVINANGSVSPCCGIQREDQDFGDVTSQPFHAVWNNLHFQTVRNYFAATLPSQPVLPAAPVCFHCYLPEEKHHCSISLDRILATFLSADPEVIADTKELLPPNLSAALHNRENHLPALSATHEVPAELARLAALWRVEVENSRMQRQYFEQSRSWRLTAPLRAVDRFMRSVAARLRT